jgi:16S rRNA (cytidine1402-2'-O)-methyltransferase
MGTLFLVATPIGNLADISQRALDTLAHVRLIACEDTRHSRKLLSHFQISTPTTSYYEHNKYSKVNYILDELALGDVALISDAGAPALNDPGYELVVSALKNGFPVSPIPGPSAPVAALTASGLPSDAFLFLGYLPRKASERRQRLTQIANLPYTIIFLEVPHRLLNCLSDMEEMLGERKIVVARELTKIHEEFVRGTIHTAREYFLEHEPRGEFTLVIEGCPSQVAHWTEQELSAWIEEQLKTNQSTGHIASAGAQISGWQRRKIYSLINQINRQK